MQEEYEAEFRRSYKLYNDIDFPGSLSDYLVSFNGFDLNWMNYIPYVAITLSHSANMDDFKWWLENLNVIQSVDPVRSNKYIADQQEAEKSSACKCALPPTGCRVGGSDISVEDCLEWPVFPPVMPCKDVGFTANSENQCPGIASGCQGGNQKYQALFSLNGVPVDCCRCESPREFDDPQPGSETCPPLWTTGKSDCDGLLVDCTDNGGAYSITFSSSDPVCCKCNPPVPQPRRLIDNEYDIFRQMMQCGQTNLFLYLGSGAWMSEYYTESVIGAWEAQLHMLEIASQSCRDRAIALAGVLYKDSACTDPYTDASTIQTNACDQNVFGCGVLGFPVRTKVGGQPATCYLKLGSDCVEHTWDIRVQNWCG
jgi:hypothetical protein